MELQWKKSPCPYMKTVARQVQNQEQTQELRLPEELPDVGRVLCAWGQPILRSKQWQGDCINVSGGVSATVMYLPEDGTFPRSVEVWIPYQVKWNLPKAGMQGNIRVKCLIQNLDARLLSARKIMVRANISLLGEVLEPQETEIFSPSEKEKEVELLTRTYPAMLSRETGEKMFTFEDDVSVPEGSKCVAWQITPQITEQSVVGSRAVIRGLGRLHYVCMDEENHIHSQQQDIPFAQFIELDREYDKQATVNVMLAVSGLEPEVTAEGIHVQCGLTAQYLLWDRMLIEVAEDAYSPLRSLDMTVEELILPMELDHRQELINAQSEFRSGKVLNMTFLPNHPTQFREGESVHLELTGSFQILFEDGEGNLQETVENWSEEMIIPAGGDCQIYATIGSVECTDGTAAAEMELNLQTRANQQIPMIKEVSVGEQRQPNENRPTLTLRRMDADSLWELAKSCGSTVDAIQRANALTQEPEKGRMLLIPIC